MSVTNPIPLSFAVDAHDHAVEDKAELLALQDISVGQGLEVPATLAEPKRCG